MERIVTFEPGHDGRKRNTGISGMTIRWLLKGPLGAVQFVVYTDWYLPHVQEEQPPLNLGLRPMGVDVGYHSPHPMYEGQSIGQEACPYLDGKPCYYDGSGLRASEWVRDYLLPHGGDTIWEQLEKEYHSRFMEVADAE